MGLLNIDRCENSAVKSSPSGVDNAVVLEIVVPVFPLPQGVDHQSFLRARENLNDQAHDEENVPTSSAPSEAPLIVLEELRLFSPVVQFVHSFLLLRSKNMHN